jgi:hypothetical protein
MKSKIFLLFFVLLIVELVARLGFSIYAHTPFMQPKHIIYKYYPMVKYIQEEYVNARTDSRKILVLSCSTLHQEWGNFDQLIKEKLNASSLVLGTDSTVNYEVYTASGIGFSSLDNLNCYTLLKPLAFDLVVFYGGINDARFNNCPSAVFKQDYSHLVWNNEVNCVLRHTEMNVSVLPFLFDFVSQKLYQRFCTDKFIPIHYELTSDWWKYGSELKSLSAFDHNILEIKKGCAQNNSKLLLLSYAYSLPNNYSLERFKSRQLDYVFQPNSRETEIWGEPQNVAKFLDSSNTHLAEMNGQDVYFYDMNSHLKAHRSYFADICHFSEEGLAVFTSTLAGTIQHIYDKQ